MQCLNIVFSVGKAVYCLTGFPFSLLPKTSWCCKTFFSLSDLAALIQKITVIYMLAFFFGFGGKDLHDIFVGDACLLFDSRLLANKYNVHDTNLNCHSTSNRANMIAGFLSFISFLFCASFLPVPFARAHVSIVVYLAPCQSKSSPSGQQR